MRGQNANRCTGFVSVGTGFLGLFRPKMAKTAETGSQPKTWIYADFRGLFRENGWCCQTGLNCRPLHYQWSALPLSYGSMPGIQDSAETGPYKAADPCHKDPACASARPACAGLKKRQNQLAKPANGFGQLSGPVRFPILLAVGPKARPGIDDCTNAARNTICWPIREPNRLRSPPGDKAMSSIGFSPGHMSRFTMQDESDKDDRQTGGHAKNPRTDRLKLALRENLKRRKSQARARSDVATASSNRDDAPPHDGGGKKPG
jgi:hypothetical protein